MGRPTTANGKTVDKDLAKRFESAFDHSDRAPAFNHGRLEWVSSQLANHGIVASKETVRKWISGQAHPRRAKMKILAKILNVDPAWLYLGSGSSDTSEERNISTKKATGVVLYVAGLVSLGGSTTAFVEEDDPQVENTHFYTIQDGRQRSFYVSLAKPGNGAFTVELPNNFEMSVLICAIPSETLDVPIFILTARAVAKYGSGRGGHINLKVNFDGNSLICHEESFKRVVNLRDFKN